MPSLTFVLPHWLYWTGLVVFPLVAMFLVYNQKGRRQLGKYSLTLGYMIWAVGGFLGLHRFYFKSLWGLLYLPLFFFILFANGQHREARTVQSDLTNHVKLLETKAKRYDKKVRQGKERYQAKLDEARAKILEIKAKETSALEELNQWKSYALWMMWLILTLLVVDAILMPRLMASAEQNAPFEEEEIDEGAVNGRSDESYISSGFTGWIDRLSYYSGEFVGYWSVIAVIVYYYEVVARYVFNSPTNWAHEAMFLMFGMQYLIAGSYAMLTESHVRVDLFYAKMSERGKAFIDILTSIFFFIFAGTLFWTGVIFARDSIEIGTGEVSFTEWAIQYWPVKCVIAIGAALLILQGLSKLIKDISIFITGQGEAKNGA